MKITPEVEEDIVRLRLAGMSIRAVARKLDVSDWTVKRVWRENKPKEENGDVEYREARVVKMALNPRIVLALVEGEDGMKRIIVKPDVAKLMAVGKTIRRVEFIEGDLWRMVGV